MPYTIDSISKLLANQDKLQAEILHLQFGKCYLAIHSNSTPLLQRLRQYFSACEVVVNNAVPDIMIQAYERPAVNLDVTYIDRQREPGKTGRKDEYYDIPHGRIVRKVRTGMLFLQSKEAKIAAGPCLENDNQVINFINSQYMNWLQQQNWLICHASGIHYHNMGIAIAGFSGGGKSTLMLEFLNHPEINFVSNDRLFIKMDHQQMNMAGIPKLPRINPGTIVGNPVLHTLMPKSTIAEYRAMPQQSLWDIESKYDVPIQQIYGQHRQQYQSPFNILILLNWQRQSTEPTTLSQVNLTQRPELLNAIMKSPGPFYQDTQGNFLNNDHSNNQETYLSLLSAVTVYEVHGKIDFKQCYQHCMHLFKENNDEL